MKSKNWAAFFRSIFLGMPDRNDLENISSMVSSFNCKNLVFFSALFSVVFAGITVLNLTSVSSKMVYTHMSLYIFMCLGSLGIHLFAILFLKPGVVFKSALSGRFVLISFYILLFMGFAYGYYVGITQPEYPGTSFCVLLVILPSMICDNPYKMDIILVFVSVVYLVSCYHLKEPQCFPLDAVNTVSFLIISVCTNTNFQKGRMEDFKNRRIIKIQRDTDSLTGAMTKSAFEVNTLRSLQDVGTSGALLILDIDNFKSINDTFGHSIGDFFIANTGHCILGCCRASDFVGRFGGDEFVILMQGVLTKVNVENKVQEITDSLKAFFANNTKYSKYSVSIGCVLFSSGEMRPGYQELFDRADHALYVAKNSGKDKCVIYGD